MVDATQRTREDVSFALPPRPAPAPVSRQGSVFDSDAPVKISRRRKAAAERGRGGRAPALPPTASSSNLPPLANRFHSRPRSQSNSRSRSRSRSPPYYPRSPLSRRLASPPRRFRRSPSSRYGSPRRWSPPPRRFNSPIPRYRRRFPPSPPHRRRRSYSRSRSRAASPVRPARSRSPVRRDRTRSRSPPTGQDARSDTLPTATSVNPTSLVPIGSYDPPRPAPSNQEATAQGPASKPETEESESARKERLRVRLQKERELAMVPEDPFERLEAEARQRKASVASRMQSKASDVGSKGIQKKTDNEGNHHRQVPETAARAARGGQNREEADQNGQQAGEHHQETVGQAAPRSNVQSDAGRELQRRIEEEGQQTLLQRVATEETRRSAAEAQKYKASLDGKREVAKKREEVYKQTRGEQVSTAKKVDGSKTASRLKGPNNLSDMEMDSDEDDGKGKVSAKVEKPDDDDDASDVVAVSIIPKKEEDDEEEDEIEIVEHKPKKEESDQEEDDDIVIVERDDVHVVVGPSNPLKRKKEEDSDDEDKPLRKQRITGPRNFGQLNKALRREPFPPRRDLLPTRREPFPPRPVVPLPARQPPAPPRRFPARIFQTVRQPAAQGPANGQAPVQQPQAPALVTAPAQQRQQQNIQAAPPSQEQWLQRMRGQEAEPRNGAVRATVLSLIEQRDVINAQLKGLYETFGREGR